MPSPPHALRAAPPGLPGTPRSGATPVPGMALPKGTTLAARARAAGQEFEAVLLSQVFSTMFSSLGQDGPLGGGGAQGIYRSLLAEEYGRTVAAAGGIGLADTVARELISIQESRAS